MGCDFNVFYGCPVSYIGPKFFPYLNMLWRVASSKENLPWELIEEDYNLQEGRDYEEDWEEEFSDILDLFEKWLNERYPVFKFMVFKKTLYLVVTYIYGSETVWDLDGTVEAAEMPDYSKREAAEAVLKEISEKNEGGDRLRVWGCYEEF